MRKKSLVSKVAGRLGINKRFSKLVPVKGLDTGVDVIVCPVEGKVVSLGKIDHAGTLESKKRKKIALTALMGEHSKIFDHGYYINIYLAPLNRHFWITPYDGKFTYTKKNDGESSIPVLIALEKVFKFIPFLNRIDMLEKATRKNATISSIFDIDGYPLAMIAVGSLNVNDIHTLYEEQKRYAKGEPAGYFSLGSSMLICFPNNADILVKKGQKVKMGQALLRRHEKDKL